MPRWIELGCFKPGRQVLLPDLPWGCKRPRTWAISTAFPGYEQGAGSCWNSTPRCDGFRKWSFLEFISSKRQSSHKWFHYFHKRGSLRWLMPPPCEEPSSKKLSFLLPWFVPPRLQSHGKCFVVVVVVIYKIPSLWIVS